MKQIDMFQIAPKLELNFNEGPINYSMIEDLNADVGESKMYPSIFEMWNRTNPGNTMIRNSGHTAISHYKCQKNSVLATVIGSECGAYHYSKPRSLTKEENCLAGTFPLDYDFKTNTSKYIIGMSVPPIMTAQIATQVYEQWLCNL